MTNNFETSDLSGAPATDHTSHQTEQERKENPLSFPNLEQRIEEPVPEPDEEVDPRFDGTKANRWYRTEARLYPHSFHPRVFILDRIPQVLLTPLAFKQMCLLVELAGMEVAWLATVSIMNNGDFLVEEAFLLRQEVHSSEAELSVEGINDLAMELMSEGKTGIAKCNKLRFWGHSHVFMETDPSHTDEMTMQTFRSEGHPWYVRGIFNKRGRAEFTIYDFLKGQKIMDAQWAIYDPATGETLKRAEESPLLNFFAAISNSGAVEKPDAKSSMTWESLAPDDAMRASLKAEYEQKVTEIVPQWFQSWNRTHLRQDDKLFGESEI